LLLSAPALAQRPANRSPAAALTVPDGPPPDSVPIARQPLSRDTTPPAIASFPRHAPAAFSADQYVVVASTTWSHDWVTRADSTDEALLRCLTASGIPTDTAHGLLDARPWRAFESEAAGAAYALFQVMPFEAPVTECARARRFDVTHLQRGVLLATASMLEANSVSRVDVYTSDQRVSPAMYGRVPVSVTEWFRRPTELPPTRPAPYQVRTYLPINALGPRGGGLPTVTLRVWNDSLRAVDVRVPTTITTQLWRELLPWQLQRFRGAAGVAPSNVPAVPSPNDAALRAAVDQYRRGEIIDAAQKAAVWRALDRAKSGGLDTAGSAALRHDRLIADVMVGGVLAAVGDTSSIAPLADDALGEAPCLVPSTPAAGAYATTLSARRPKARCSSLPSSRVARAGLVFPGGGHSVVGDRGRAVVAASLVIGALGGAAVATAVEQQRYNTYKDATSVEAAVQGYDSAVAMRNVALGLVAGSAAIWLADMWYAVVREKHHAAAVRSQMSFGRERCGNGRADGCAR
jgi:hypothetical protein